MPDYSAYKVIELKEILKSRGLAVSGAKSELIARIEQSDAELSAKETTVDETNSPSIQIPVKTSEVETASEAAVKPSSDSSIESQGDESNKNSDATASVIQDLEKRIARSKRFGTDFSELELELTRVKRFGVPDPKAKKVSSPVSKSEAPAKNPLGIDEETLRRRREKFGLA